MSPEHFIRLLIGLFAFNCVLTVGPPARAQDLKRTASNPETLYREGIASFKDLRDKESLRKGFRLFEEAAAAGHADALNAMGVAKVFGFGTDEMSGSSGGETLRKAADAGSIKALCNLSSLIFFKIGIKADEKLALSYLEKAALKGDAAAQYRFGKALLDAGPNYDPELANQWFKRAALQDDKNAAAFVAALHLSKKIKDANPASGLLLLNQLAAASNGVAKYFLGEHFGGFSKEDSGDIDPALALQRFIEADELGARPFPQQAARALTRQIAEGKFGVERTKQVIAKLETLRKNCLASCLLAEIYLVEASKFRDYTKGRRILLNAAKSECATANVRLGDVYALGLGVKTNLVKAQEFYSSVLNTDATGEAPLKAATILFRTAQDEQAMQKAYQIGLEAAKSDNPQAFDLLASVLIRGQTRESQALEKAYAWALLAADRNQVQVQTPPSRLEDKLTEAQKLEGVKISQYFRIIIRKRALERGESSFLF